MVVSLKDYSSVNSAPGGSGGQAFNFVDFFHGHTHASGWFADRFGKPRKHFCGDFHGSFDGDDFLLDEKLYYTSGMKEERVWKVNISDSGVFTAESESLIGRASGLLSNDRLAMRYSMKVLVDSGKYWDLDMKDLMVLQPDGTLHNITHVYKWGFRIGTVSTQYQQHDGQIRCSDKLGMTA